MIEVDENDCDAGTTKGISRLSRNKKSASAALINAVRILASAKSEGEERKFDFFKRAFAAARQATSQRIGPRTRTIGS